MGGLLQQFPRRLKIKQSGEFQKQRQKIGQFAWVGD